MWINWTHENRLRKESPDRNIALAVLRRNIIILQCSSRYKLGHGSVNSTVGHGGALAVLTPLSPARSARRSSPAGAFLSGDYRIRN